jgi:hypothetical protein
MAFKMITLAAPEDLYMVLNTMPHTRTTRRLTLWRFRQAERGYSESFISRIQGTHCSIEVRGIAGDASEAELRVKCSYAEGDLCISFRVPLAQRDDVFSTRVLVKQIRNNLGSINKRMSASLRPRLINFLEDYASGRLEERARVVIGRP